MVRAERSAPQGPCPTVRAERSAPSGPRHDMSTKLCTSPPFAQATRSAKRSAPNGPRRKDNAQRSAPSGPRRVVDATICRLKCEHRDSCTSYTGHEQLHGTSNRKEKLYCTHTHSFVYKAGNKLETTCNLKTRRPKNAGLAQVLMRNRNNTPIIEYSQ